MDGRVLTELLSDEDLTSNPIRTVAGVAGENDGGGSSMSTEDEQDLEESLRALGYL